MSNTTKSTKPTKTSNTTKTKKSPDPSKPAERPAAVTAEPGGQSVTVFSNGATDFRRVVRVTGEQTISIPVRKDYVADVLDSLHVSGNVRLARPASYSPANDNAGNLAVGGGNAVVSLAAALSGARVRINEVLEGTMMGTDADVQTAGNNATVESRYLVVQTPAGIRRVALSDVKTLAFTDGDVRAEVDKALRRNFQQIKPNSTFVDLTLSADPPAEAVVQYTTPTAAWKMSYRLRKTASGFEFQGLAIVDNNTDQEWTDVDLAVVTGEPITFRTDIAESKVPERMLVNIVDDEAQGAVEVEEGMGPVEMLCASAPAESRPRRSRAATAETAGGGGPAAGYDPAEVTAVGDFSVFRSPSKVTIPANRSALIPVFTTHLGEARTVLHYRAANHPDRPFRSVKFRNETAHALGRGPCVVHEDGTFQGKCVIPATRPGGECLLPHAVETGVRVGVRVETEHIDLGIKLAKGVLYRSSRVTHRASYAVQNQKDDAFELVLDHDSRFGPGELPETRTTWQADEGGAELAPPRHAERLANGLRFELPLSPRARGVLRVTETRVTESVYNVAGASSFNVLDSYIAANKSLVNESVRGLLEVRSRYDEKQEEVEAAKDQLKSLDQRSTRLRQNLQASGTASGTARFQEWQDDLSEVEKSMRSLNEEALPALKKELKAIQKELESALKDAVVEWKA